MALVKCPRCELNYMQDTEKLCTVCRSEMRGGEVVREEVADLCVECGEHAVAPGEELCYFCIKEIRQQENLLLGAADTSDADLALSAGGAIDEIAVDDLDEELPERDFVPDDEDDEEDAAEVESEEVAVDSLEALEEEEFAESLAMDEEDDEL